VVSIHRWERERELARHTCESHGFFKDTDADPYTPGGNNMKTFLYVYVQWVIIKLSSAARKDKKYMCTHDDPLTLTE